MIDVSDLTIKAYTEYASSKSITIRFPNDSTLSPITNKNLQEESMKLNNSICEETFLQIQGCNASQFEITTFDIQTDLTDKDIEVSLSVKDPNYKGTWVSGVSYSVGDVVKYDNKYYQYIKSDFNFNSPQERFADEERAILTQLNMSLRNYQFRGVNTGIKALKIVAPYLLDGVYAKLTVVNSKNGRMTQKRLDSLDYVNYIDMTQFEQGENVNYYLNIIYQESEELVLERIQSAVNIAQGKDVYASSTKLEDAYLPSETVDGNLETRWASIDNVQDEPNQWIYIDLGEENSIYDIAIFWENAFATKYIIQTSADGEIWSAKKYVQASKSEIVDLLFNENKFEAITTRYVRIYCSEPFNYTYGYSIWELGIFDTIPNYLFEFQDFVHNMKVVEVLPSYQDIRNVPPGDSRTNDLFQEIYGYVDTSQVPDIIIFKGKINSFEKQSDPRYRDLIAYDKLYEASNISIKSWINTVNSDGIGYIEKYNYRGLYDTSITDYKAGDSVSVISPIYVNGIVVGYNYDYYVFLKDFVVPEYRGYSLGLIASDGYPGTISGIDKGSTYVELRNDYSPNRTTIKTLRDNLCDKLGIEQENITLPLDDVTLIIGEFTEEISGTQLLQWICNLNMVCGYIVPQTEKLRYIFINKENQNLSQDTNYKGNYTGQAVSQGDILSTKSDIDTTLRYYKALCNTGNTNTPTQFNIKPVTFISPVENVFIKAPGIRGNDWCIDFDWNPSELQCEIEIYEYKGPNTAKGNSITITSPARIYLTDITLNGNYMIQVRFSESNTGSISELNTTIYEAKGLSVSYYPPYSEIVSAFWEQCNKLYHPSGRINLSDFYETEGVVLKDMDYISSGYKVVDTSNNILYEPLNNTANTYIPISYNFLYAWKDATQLYNDVAYGLGYGQYSIQYTPYSLSLLGMPFLEPGDYICFDVTEWTSDEDNNPVTTTRTVNSIILNKTLSGLVALMDSLEAN